MKRLRHIAFSWLGAISFLLFVLSSVMWPVSYWRSPSLSIDPLGADLRHDSHNLCCAGAVDGAFVASLYHSINPITVEEAFHRERDGIKARPIEFEAQLERADGPGHLAPFTRSFLGFGYRVEHVDDPGVDKLLPFESAAGAPMKYKLIAVQVPLWVSAIVFCLIPFGWIRARWRNYRRAKYGLCQRCGYDVRVTPRMCPECGAQSPLVIPRREPILLMSVAFLFASASLLICVLSIAGYWRSAAFHFHSPADKGDYYFERSGDFSLRDGVLNASLEVMRTKVAGTLTDPLRQPGSHNGEVFLTGSWGPKDTDELSDADTFQPFTREMGGFGYRFSRDDSEATEPDAPRTARLIDAAWKCPLWFVAIVVAMPVVVTVIIKRRRAIRSRGCGAG